MKKILLISDTHGYIDDRIIQYAKQSDETWHAGDIGELKVTDELKKVTVAIQGESVRITGKSKDDLQAAIQLVKSKEDELDVPLQFENYR